MKKRRAEVAATQRLRVQRLGGIGAPFDAVGRVPAAGPDGDFPLGRVEKQLKIADIRKLSHTEKIEGDPLTGYGHCRALIAGLQKLASDHLISLQIECGEHVLLHSGFSLWRFYAIGRAVVKSGVVVDPVVVDGNESAKNSAVYDLEAGQSAADMVLTVLEKRLRHFERLS